MPTPERQTRADLAAAAAIALVVVIVAVVIWQHSQARATVSRTATRPVPVPTAVTTAPTGLRELWHTADRMSDGAAVTVNGVVVTADGGTVTGRIPTDGTEIWRYQRDRTLCGVTGAWGIVVAAYRDGRGCSQVTELAATTGARTAGRSSLADSSLHLSIDNAIILAQGPRRLELWRSDLVRTLEYGYVDAPVNPQAQPRSGCTLRDAALNGVGTRLVVLEQCPGDSGSRVTVLNPNPKDNQKPEEYASTVLTDTDPAAGEPRLAAVSGERIAVYFPGLAAHLETFDTGVRPVARSPLGDRIDSGSRAQRVGSLLLLRTDAGVLALDPNSLAPLWSVPGALGVGPLVAGRLLLPVEDGYTVIDPVNGMEIRRIPLSRNGYRGPVEATAIGATMLERRGGELYALGAV